MSIERVERLGEGGLLGDPADPLGVAITAAGEEEELIRTIRSLRRRRCRPAIPDAGARAARR
jgi:hypothetical protein